MVAFGDIAFSVTLSFSDWELWSVYGVRLWGPNGQGDVMYYDLYQDNDTQFFLFTIHCNQKLLFQILTCHTSSSPEHCTCMFSHHPLVRGYLMHHTPCPRYA